MRMYKAQIQVVIVGELADLINKQGYALHTDFVNMIHNKYGFCVTNITGILARTYPTLDLIKRHTNTDIKRFYNIAVKGNALIYLRKRSDYHETTKRL